jgi:small conductance mechanosensitive channel
MDITKFDPSDAVDTLVALVSQWGLKVVGAIVVLIVGRWVAGRVRKALTAGMARSKLDPTLVPFVASVAYYAIIAFVIVAVLGLFGIPTASFIAVLGAAGLAVGFALQGTLSNFAAGVMLLTFRPFRLGDYVDAGGTAGSVAAIGVFTTTLNTPDNVQITVPNSGVFGQTIKNYSANPTRRNDMVVGVSYGDDLGVALETIRRVLAADQRVLKEPAPTVAVSELGDSSVNIVVRPWCTKEDYWALRFDLTRAFKEELEKAGCSIPFPQRDVHVHEVGKAA